MALPEKNRLSSKKEIDSVFRNGKSVSGGFLFAKTAPSDKGYSRAAFVIPSKHIRLAVDRNKARRIMSEALRGRWASIPRGLDILIIVSRKVARDELEILADEINKLADKITAKK